MAQKNTAALKTEKDANITSNGANTNTGANHNTFLENLLDSFVNKSTDALLTADNIYRCGSVAVVAGVQKTVTFSTVLSVNTYQVFITDNDSVGWEGITSKTTASFKITGLGTGNISYLVILDL